ncbi:MAG: leucine-rich repeat domain-containing protein [Muribaculaceae bacterium]|nr:leucine-rich repeat domain-containing protein [Muribaculaceae bacterium]
MKRVAIFTSALLLAASAASAESVTIVHETAGGLQAELDAAIAASETLSSYADITELTITGEAAMNANDFVAIRANLRPSLLILDMSQAVFANNKLPGGDYDKQGILQTMNVVEVRLPETLTGLSGGAFYKCAALEKVNLPDGIKTINQYCFSECEKLNIERLPANLTSIAADAFRGCASLTLTELPSTIKTIGGDAFNEGEVNKLSCPGIAFSQLPDDLEKIGERAFRRTSCTFSEWPEKLTAIPSSAFSATLVSFKELSPNITSVGTYAFQSVKTMPEFTITDQADLWTKIPDGCFFVQTDDVARSFICRAPSAPQATVNVGSGAWSGTFSQVAKNPNTTFKVLASALESYQNTAPYNTMNLEVLKTAVPQPVVEMPAGHDASNVSVCFVVNGVEHDGFDEVLEGEGKLVVSFLASAHEWLHVKEIRYDSAQAYAEEETEGDEVDPDLLYQVDNVSQSLRKTIEVPVNVTPDMKPLRIAVAMADVLTGIEEAEAPAAAVNRTGDVITLSVPGAALYDLAGRKVAATTGNTLHLGGLPAGGYILRANKTVVKILK